MKTKLHTSIHTFLADTMTPVGIYLRLRDVYPNTILLESSDYHGNEHSFSYICCNPVAKFEVANNTITTQLPGAEIIQKPILDKKEVVSALHAFTQTFECETTPSNHIQSGLFGYTSYNAVQYFEDVDIQPFEDDSRKIADILYHLYKVIIVYNHFRNEVKIIEIQVPGQDDITDIVLAHLNKKDVASYDFEIHGSESSNYTDEVFRSIIQKGKDHCHRGDVFQIVLSRRFNRAFSGDEFNVYRALRRINPSPYLFYFDFGDYKIFGSSPEAQIVIKNRKATIYPIAGTFRRTGNDREDYDLAKKLFNDPKENSEHVMLVDLARNDLSRNGHTVHVETFKEIQYFSHVIHLVSKVVGTMDDTTSSIQLVADTFPAGTLSGAPKHNAMTLINRYENSCRGYYGGAIGHIGFDGSFNHAIMIRSILSKGNTLFYQAGAGVVDRSVVESELQEVHNKLAALKSAIDLAQKDTDRILIQKNN